MRMIKKLAEMIEEEIDDAEKYAKCAVLQKDTDPDLARMFSDLSEQELKHATRIHDEVVRLIDEAKAVNRTVPAGMMEMYEYLHARNIEHVAEVKGYLAQYKE